MQALAGREGCSGSGSRRTGDAPQQQQQQHPASPTLWDRPQGGGQEEKKAWMEGASATSTHQVTYPPPHTHTHMHPVMLLTELTEDLTELPLQGMPPGCCSHFSAFPAPSPTSAPQAWGSWGGVITHVQPAVVCVCVLGHHPCTELCEC